MDIALNSRTVQQFGALVYCEFYQHCRKVPCNHSAVNFSKNHDFDNELPKKRGGRYLVQYRDPLPALMSFFEYSVRKSFCENTRINWNNFFERHLRYYRAFVSKWVRGNEGYNIHIVKYEDLISNPLEIVGASINFFNAGEQIDWSWLKMILATHPPDNSRSIRKFPYWDADLIERVK